MLGGEEHPAGEAVFSGRKIRLTERGIEVDGDNKHSKALRNGWKLESGKGVETPWSEEDVCKADHRESFSKSEATDCRRAAARINFKALKGLTWDLPPKKSQHIWQSPVSVMIVRSRSLSVILSNIFVWCRS